MVERCPTRRLILVDLFLLAVYLTIGCGAGDDESPRASSTVTAEQSTATPSRQTSPTPVTTPTPAIAQLEQWVVARINEIRREHDLPPLEPTGALAAVARRYSCRMAQDDFFAHRSPSGDTVADRLRQADLAYRLVGENLARNTNAEEPARRAVQGWMDSKTHRQNILREGFTQTGVGICREGRRFYVTQVFRQPP